MKLDGLPTLRGINAPAQGPQFPQTTGSATSVEIYFKKIRSESTIRSSLN
jgi:hypothetical protein